MDRPPSPVSGIGQQFGSPSLSHGRLHTPPHPNSGIIRSRFDGNVGLMRSNLQHQDVLQICNGAFSILCGHISTRCSISGPTSQRVTSTQTTATREQLLDDFCVDFATLTSSPPAPQVTSFSWFLLRRLRKNRQFSAGYVDPSLRKFRYFTDCFASDALLIGCCDIST